jgi:hypothetical protein
MLNGIYCTDDPPSSDFAFRVLDTVDDMTAIALVYMPDGMVIGADGLRRHSSTGIILTSEGQKVFEFKNENITSAYAWWGTTVRFGENGESFEFSCETGDLLKKVKGESLDEFIRNFCSALQSRLSEADLPISESDWLTDYGVQIPKMAIVGYFNQQPFAVRIEISPGLHELTVLCTQIGTEERYLRVFSGSTNSTVGKNIHRKPKDIEDARCLIHDYIDCCRGEKVNGKVHVALVTPDSFSWLDSPLHET